MESATAQGTIKTLMKSCFSSDLTHFLAIMGGGGGAQPKMLESSHGRVHHWGKWGNFPHQDFDPWNLLGNFPSKNPVQT